MHTFSIQQHHYMDILWVITVFQRNLVLWIYYNWFFHIYSTFLSLNISLPQLLGLTESSYICSIRPSRKKWLYLFSIQGAMKQLFQLFLYKRNSPRLRKSILDLTSAQQLLAIDLQFPSSAYDRIFWDENLSYYNIKYQNPALPKWTKQGMLPNFLPSRPANHVKAVGLSQDKVKLSTSLLPQFRYNLLISSPVANQLIQLYFPATTGFHFVLYSALLKFTISSQLSIIQQD